MSKYLTWGFSPKVRKFLSEEYIHINGWYSENVYGIEFVPYSGCKILNFPFLQSPLMHEEYSKEFTEWQINFKDSIFFQNLKQSFFDCSPRERISSMIYPNPLDIITYLNHQIFIAYKLLKLNSFKAVIFAIYPHGSFDLCLYFVARYLDINVFCFRDNFHINFSMIYKNSFDNLPNKAWDKAPLLINSSTSKVFSDYVLSMEKCINEGYKNMKKFQDLYSPNYNLKKILFSLRKSFYNYFVRKIIFLSIRYKIFKKILNVLAIQFSDIFFIKANLEKIDNQIINEKINKDQLEVDQFIYDYSLTLNSCSNVYSPKFFIARYFVKNISKIFKYCYPTQKRNEISLSEIRNLKYSIALFLHLQPEASTFVEGGLYQDQLEFIKEIRSVFPKEIKIIIKLPPAINSIVSYKYNYQFNEIAKKLPGIYIANKGINPLQLIQNVKAVATISGSCGYESIYLNKPVIYSGAPLWHSSNLAYNLRDIIKSESCSREIIDIIFRKSDHNNSYKYQNLEKSLSKYKNNFLRFRGTRNLNNFQEAFQIIEQDLL